MPPTSLVSSSPTSTVTDKVLLYHRLRRTSPQLVTTTYHRRDLIEIAMRTINLLQRNRMLHARLQQLRMETRQFVDSVMSNPENAELRHAINTTNSNAPSKTLAIRS